MTAALPLLVVLASVAVAGWHTDRVERRNRWRRLADASALPRAGWDEKYPEGVSRLVVVCRCDLLDARRDFAASAVAGRNRQTSVDPGHDRPPPGHRKRRPA